MLCHEKKPHTKPKDRKSSSSLSLKAYCDYYTTQNSFLQGHSKVFNEKN
jgi:hypothetical protein